MRTQFQSNLKRFLEDLGRGHPVVVSALERISERTHTPERELRRVYPETVILPKDELRISLEAVHRRLPAVKHVFENVREGLWSVPLAIDLLGVDEPAYLRDIELSGESACQKEKPKRATRNKRDTQ